jgi:hypothetical protein
LDHLVAAAAAGGRIGFKLNGRSHAQIADVGREGRAAQSVRRLSQRLVQF